MIYYQLQCPVVHSLPMFNQTCHRGNFLVNAIIMIVISIISHITVELNSLLASWTRGSPRAVTGWPTAGGSATSDHDYNYYDYYDDHDDDHDNDRLTHCRTLLHTWSSSSSSTLIESPIGTEQERTEHWPQLRSVPFFLMTITIMLMIRKMMIIMITFVDTQWRTHWFALMQLSPRLGQVSDHSPLKWRWWWWCWWGGGWWEQWGIMKITMSNLKHRDAAV